MFVPQIIEAGRQFPGEPAPVPFAQRSLQGDIAINRLDATTGQLLDFQYLLGAGHGTSAAVAPDGRLWTDADASSSGFARALCLLNYTPGAITQSSTTNIVRPFGPGTHGMSCAIDILHNRFVVRQTFPDPGDGRRHTLFALDDAMNLYFGRPLAVINQAANQPPNTPGAIGTAQGMTTYGDYMYSYEGDIDLNNTYLSRLNWSTGATEQKVFVGVMSDITPREPEGLAVQQLANPVDNKLVFGLSGGTDGAKKYNLAYIPTIAPIALPGEFGRGGYGTGGYGE